MQEPADIVIARAYYSDCTLGRLLVTATGWRCFTLELPWRGNAASVSAVPEGLYPYRVATSPRTGKPVIWIDNVPERTAIQIHPANYTRQIEGCTAVGDSVRDLDGDTVPDVTNSEATLYKLLAKIPDTGWIRFITAEPPGRGVYDAQS